MPDSPVATVRQDWLTFAESAMLQSNDDIHMCVARFILAREQAVRRQTWEAAAKISEHFAQHEGGSKKGECPFECGYRLAAVLRAQGQEGTA